MLESMKTSIRRLGNSRGVIIPKPMLLQLGLEAEAELTLENDAIVIRRPRQAPREGWAEACRLIAAAGPQDLAWPEFGNQDDAALKW